MPTIAAALEPGDAELAALRGRSVTAITTLLENAQRDGAIRPDLTFGDISLLLIRLARPLPPGRDLFPPAVLITLDLRRLVRSLTVNPRPSRSYSVPIRARGVQA